jgi:hypothetical protein
MNPIGAAASSMTGGEVLTAPTGSSRTVSVGKEGHEDVAFREMTWCHRPMNPPSNSSRSMSDEHKAALAEGRAQSRAVRNYLDALEATRPKRGRKRTPQSIEKRLARIEAEVDDASPTKRLELVQERMDLQAELAAMDDRPDLDALQGEFVTNAKAYSERKGISYAAWRELGVEAAVLKEAGIGRGR